LKRVRRAIVTGLIQ